jgi:DNA polymerase I-like protein with 3'-5' exonuclease and polymerase domains
MRRTTMGTQLPVRPQPRHVGLPLPVADDSKLLIDQEELEQTYTPSWYDESALAVLAEAQADSPELLACDTETSGVAFYDEAFCASIAWRGLDRETGQEVTKTGYFDLGSSERKSALREVLDTTPQWVFHNAKFDLQKLILAGVIDHSFIRTADGLHDTHALAHLIDERWDGGLKDLAVSLLGRDDTIEVALISDPTRTRLVSREAYELERARSKLKVKKEDGYGVLPRRVVVPYALTDAEITLDLYSRLKPIMDAKDVALRRLYGTEMRLSLTLLRMEEAGLGVNVPYIETEARRINSDMAREEQKVLEASGEVAFKQHAPWIRGLLEKEGIRVPNAQRDTLIQVDHPIAQGYVERGKLKKLSEYFDAMRREQRDGILHTSYKQHKPVTGRMASGEQEIT